MAEAEYPRLKSIQLCDFLYIIFVYPASDYEKGEEGSNVARGAGGGGQGGWRIFLFMSENLSNLC